FFSHQPDLNYDNPAVRRAMLDAVRFWLDRGLDGFRCDAAWYLVGREGPTWETLPEAPPILKEFRTVIDREYGGARVLLAEANQWPEDVRPYFGDGDEFHMAFNFPLMPRLYLGLRLEDSRPITDIFMQMPPIPPACQWGLFLRNHDELTLEMVTNEERAFMYYAYARERDMKLNLGIRRRLAPPRPAPELPVAHAAREPDHLLRRRDRHGRQRLARRPERRAHAHAVVARPQRGILERGSRRALPAGHRGSGLRLRGRQRCCR